MGALLNLAFSIGLAATFAASANAAAELPFSEGTTGGGTSSQDKPRAKVDMNPVVPVQAAPVVEKPFGNFRLVNGPFAEVNERVVRLERRIVDAMSHSRLSPSEAISLKAELDRVNELETACRAASGKLKEWQKAKLNYDLDKLSGRLESTMRDRQIASVDLEFVKEDTLKRIDSAAQAGRLSFEEVRSLKQEFNRISALEALLKRSNNKLSYVDKMMLCVDFDHLAARMRRQMSERGFNAPKIDLACTAMEKKLTEGAAKNKLNSELISLFRQEIQELVAAEKKMKNRNVELSSEQILALGLSVEVLSNRIDAALSGERMNSSELDSRVKEIDKRLGYALYIGKLNPKECFELKEDLDEIKKSRAAMESAEGGARIEEIGGLMMDIARLDARVDRQMHGPSRIWSGLEPFAIHQSVRVKDALAAKRLTEDEAKQFGAEVDQISKVLTDYENRSDALSASGSLDIAIQLQQLNGRLDKAMKDRDYPAPDLVALQAAINNRIGDTILLGELTPEEGRDFELELKLIQDRLAASTSLDGKLPQRDALLVDLELHKLAREMEAHVHNHESVFPGIEIRRDQIDALITEGLSSGRLTSVEAQAFRDGLEKSISDERNLRNSGKGVSSTQALALINQLENTYENISRTLQQKQIMTSDLVALMGAVERRIAEGACKGLLSMAEAENLRRDYDILVGAFAKGRSSAGGLSYGDRLAAGSALQQLGATVERQLREQPLPLPNLDTIARGLDKQVGNALAGGKLSVEEANIMKGQLDHVMSLSHMHRNSGGGTSYAEGLILATDLDRLSRQLTFRMANQKGGLQDIDSRQALLEKDIQAAKSSGKISGLEAESLFAELDRIAQTEASFRLTDESLNFVESINLSLDLDRIETRLSKLKNISSASQNHQEKVKSTKPTSPKKGAVKKGAAISRAGANT